MAEVQGPAIRVCRGRHPGMVSKGFQAVARLSAEGSVEELLIRPAGGFHDCLRQEMRAVTLPPPPKSPYWIFWGTSGLR